MVISHAGVQLGLSGWVLCGTLAFGPAPATASAAPPFQEQTTDAAARAEFDALEEALEADQATYEKQMREWYEANKVDESTASAEAKEKFQAAFTAWWKEHDPSPRYVGRFEALARKHVGSEVALDSWLRVIELDGQDALVGTAERPLTNALAALLRDHLKSEKLEAFCLGLQYGSALPHATVIETCAKIRAGSPHEKVQAAATFAQAAELSGERGGVEGKRAARELYAELAARFSTLAMPNGKSYGRVADGYLFELDHLQVGQNAPDFEALDETGARFKLSDYRGKVVMLDFWGFW